MFQGYNFPIPLSSTNMTNAKAATTSDDDGGKYTQKNLLNTFLLDFAHPFANTYIWFIYSVTLSPIIKYPQVCRICMNDPTPRIIFPLILWILFWFNNKNKIEDLAVKYIKQTNLLGIYHNACTFHCSLFHLHLSNYVRLYSL